MAELGKLGLVEFQPGLVVAAAGLHGSFARQGLEVESTLTRNSTEQMQGLCEGRWQLASTAFDNVLAWSGRTGEEIVAIAAAAHGLTLPLVARPEIRTWDDLRGRPLAVDAVDTAYALVLRRILQAHGLDLDRGDYSLVPAGATQHRYASLSKGETFAGILNPPWDQRAVAEGMVRLGDHRAVLPDYPGIVYAATRSFAQANRARIVSFLRGLVDATRWLLDTANTAQALKQIAGGDDETEKRLKGQLANVAGELTLNNKGLGVVLDLRVRFGMTPPKGSDLGIYVDASYAEEAVAGMH